VGATRGEISYCLYGYGGVLSNVDPEQGQMAVRPSCDGHITLQASNSAGSDEATIYVGIRCHHEWVPEVRANPPSFSRECPAEAVYSFMGFQRFEHGFMIWVESADIIYVFYDTGSYEVFRDDFNEGDPETDPRYDDAPPGREQPIRGFGLVWRTNQRVRDGLGWATEHERGYDGWTQSFDDGRRLSGCIVRGIDGTIYRLTPTYRTWRVYQP